MAKGLISLCLLPLLIGTAVAQETLTLDNAVKLAMTDNPELKAFHYELGIQDARIVQAGLKPRPELNISVEDVLGTGVAQGFSGSQSTVSIAWVSEGGLAQRRIDVARTGSLTLAVEAEVMRLDTAAEVARLFMQGLALQSHQSLADESIAYASEILTTIEAKIEAGTGFSADLARADAQRERLLLYREDMNHELEVIFHRLAALWGELTPEFSSVTGDLNSLPELPPFSSLLTRIEETPDIQRFFSEERLQESILQLELAQQSAPWRFNAGVRRIQSSSDTGFVAGLTIPLDRGNRNQGRIQEARASLEKIDADKTAAQIRMHTNLFAVYQELEHNLHRVDVLQSAVIPKYEEALAEVRRSYELGAISYLDWLQIQESVQQTRSELIEARLQAQLKNIEIERLTGIPVAQPTPSR